jgi:lipoyl(octanoyl) transferase
MSSEVKDLSEVEWIVSDGLLAYPEAVATMEARVAAIREGRARELVWLVEHPPLYTAGSSARREDLRDSDRFPVYETGRGGQFTYHGPGQRVGYVMLDLAARGGDVRRFVHGLEAWLIATLLALGVEAGRREGRIGIWVDRGPHPLGGRREDKIAALGVRVRRGVTFHGVALNVNCDLTHFTGIVPCGIADTRYGVTSLAAIGVRVTIAEVDEAMRRGFEGVFGARHSVSQ